VARFVGAADGRSAAHQAVQGAWLAIGIGVALLAVGVVAAPAAVSLFVDDVSSAVGRNAVVYLRVSALGAPAVLLALAGVGYLRGLQDTTRTLVIAVASNVANLVLELVLIYGLDMGIAASAAATVVAQWGAAAAYVGVLLRHVRRSEVSLRPDRRRLRALVVVGRDLFVRTGSLLAALAVATAVASGLGEVPLAAHQIAFQLWSFLALVLDAVAIAGQAMIGRLLGAGAADEARSVSIRMQQWGVAAGVLFAVVVIALRQVLVPIFTDDPAVRALASSVLVVVALLQPLNAIVFVLDGVLIGAGDLRYLAKAMAVSGLGVFLPTALVVSRWSGATLLWLWGALALLMAARLAGNLWRFAGTAWQVVGAER
jgi:putative MATE family efflux protein